MSKVKRVNLYMIGLLIIGISLQFTFLVFKLPKAGFFYDFRELVYPGTAVLLFFLITKEKPQKIFQFHTISMRNIIYIILMTALFSPLVGTISALSQLLFPNQAMGNAIRNMSNGPIWFALIISALLPAIFEEMSFRGIVRNGYEEYPLKKQAIIVGLYFGFFHLNFDQFFYTAVFGFFMVYVFYNTRSIVATMLFHFLNNGSSVLLDKVLSHIYLPQSTLPKGYTLSPEYIIGIIIGVMIIILILAIDYLLFYLVYRSFAKYNRKIHNDDNETDEYAILKQNSEKRRLLTPVFFVIAGIFVLFASFVQIHYNLIK